MGGWLEEGAGGAMSYYGNPCIACFNVVATAWLCAYCCGPLLAPIVVVPTRTVRVSEAMVTGEASKTEEAVATVPDLPLIAVPCSMGR